MKKYYGETENTEKTEDELLNYYFKASSLVNIVLAIVVALLMFFSTNRTLAYGDQIIEKTLPIIAMAESTNNPNAISSDGGYGLYQISDPCLKDYNRANKTEFVLENMLDPVLCEKVAKWYLEHLKKRLGKHYNQQTLVLSYNWGFRKVKKNDYKIPNWAKKHPNRIYRQVFLAKV